MNWNDAYSGIINNVEYAANFVARRTSLEKEDVHQEILLTVWTEFFKSMEKGAEVTKYGLQKRIIWASSRIIKNFYRKKSVVVSNSCELDENIIGEDSDNIVDKMCFKEMVGKVYAELKAKANKTPAKVMDLLLHNLRNKEISEITDLTEKNISLIIYREIKSRLRIKAEEYGYI